MEAGFNSLLGFGNIETNIYPKYEPYLAILILKRIPEYMCLKIQQVPKFSAHYLQYLGTNYHQKGTFKVDLRITKILKLLCAKLSNFYFLQTGHIANT